MPIVIYKNKKVADESIQLILENNANDRKINKLIRKRYSPSQELALHRKKIIKACTAEEWNAYVEYIEWCIRQVEGENNDNS